jgi:hypothetical protein
MDSTTPYLIFLSSTDSLDIYPQNTFADFTCELKDGLTLQGSWEVGLTETYYDTALANEQFDIFTDIIEYTVVNGKYVPMLRRIFCSGEYNTLYYIRERELKRIRIYITNKSADKPSVDEQTFHCTLRLRRKGK